MNINNPDNLPTETLKTIEKIHKKFSISDPLHSTLLGLSSPSISKIQTTVLPKITVHDSSKVPSVGYSKVKYSPESHSIDIFHSPSLNQETLQKQLTDSFIRAGYANLFKHLSSGKKQLLKQIPLLEDNKPLSSSEHKVKQELKANKKITHLDTIKKILSLIQKSAYEELDKHHYRHTRNLKLHIAKHKDNKYSPGINNLIISHMKQYSSLGNRYTPKLKTIILAKKTRTPETAKHIGLLYSYLSRNLNKYIS